ncbi:MAG TPA: glycoside hydrolase family 3 N-terminal domain-containing protein [Candidatus Micrarchaeaceae archaeon]|nr:glycoside hydrolase family 3 N-terminal domain-containing protein [Candidatus Micrarchaeaceae archaeon]
MILVVAIVAAVIHVVSDWRRGPLSADLPTGTVVLTSPSPAASPTPNAQNDAASLQNDIGSILVVAQSGTTISPTLRSLVMKGRVGGVLLFASNFKTPAGLKVWTTQLRALASEACLGHPLLVMLDEEGGQVNQVKASFAGPSQLAVGAGGAANVRAQERRVGAGLRQLGVGLDLAPVADVRTNPKDLVIGDRSFGSSTATVAPLVAAAVKGLHDGGVGATLKHFPGLGGAAGDPHVAIPTDSETAAQWARVQMPAFKAGIAAGADAVMTTAVYVPGLGASHVPAMLSAAVVSRLRTQLGFQGVIMTDSLSMGGVGARYSLPQAAVMAVAAGNDLILLSNGDPVYETKAMTAIKSAVISGQLDRAQVHESAMRVNQLRDKWGLPLAPCVS